MSSAVRAARQFKIKSPQILHFKAQIRTNPPDLSNANIHIRRLETRLAALKEEKAVLHPFKSPSDQILADIWQNSRRLAQGRGYSPETLMWAGNVNEISPHAWSAVRKVLPVPGQRLLLAKLPETRGVSDVFANVDGMGELITLWREAIPEGLPSCAVTRSVDAVAFRRVITIHEDGHVEGFKTMSEFDSPDIFSQFVSNPRAFASFVKDHWDDTYTAVFAFHHEPLHPHVPCSIIHPMPVRDGKGMA
jgi:hypothetical protein